MHTVMSKSTSTWMSTTTSQTLSTTSTKIYTPMSTTHPSPYRPSRGGPLSSGKPRWRTRFDADLEAVRRLCREDPAVALERAEGLLERARARRSPILVARVLTQIGRCHALQTRFPLADACLRDAAALLRSPRNALERAEVLRLRGRYCSLTGNVQEGLEYLLEALAVFRGADALEGAVNTLSHLGALYHSVGDHVRSLEFQLEALSLCEDGVGDAATADVLRHLGWTWIELFQREKAVDCLERSLALYRTLGETYGQMHVFSALAAASRYLGLYDQALNYLEQATALAGPHHRELIAGILLERGRVLQARGDFEASLEPLLECRASFSQCGAHLHAGNAACDLGIALSRLGRLDEALEMLLEAHRLALECSDKTMEYDASIQLSTLCERLGRTADAFAWLKRGHEVREEISSPARLQVLTSLQLRFEAEQAARSQAHLRREAQRLEEEIRTRTLELSATALSLEEKHCFLEAVKRELASALRRSEQEMKPALEALLRQVDRTLRSEDEHGLQGEELEAMHDDFLARLAQRFPALTRTELKICGLLRLNRATKEIASLLHVSPRDVENHRYRLRKKLGLSRTTHLNTFLASLASSSPSSE